MQLLDVVQYQVVHRAGGLLVRIVARETAPRDLPDRVRGAIEDALAKAGARCVVEVEVVPTIARDGGPAAKVKLVVSEAPGQ